MSPEPPTLIVGGGISGLMCARTLALAGAPVRLLERDLTVGGRVRTTVQRGFQLDHGFQVLFNAYPVLSAALDLPALRLRAFRPAAFIAYGGAAPSVIGDALADFSLLWPTLRAPSLSLVDKLRMLRLRSFATSLAFDDCFADRYDRVSTLVFLRARGFSERAITQFFAPFYGGILLDRSLQTSAAVLLYTFKMLAEGRTVVPAAGMGAIPAQLASALPAGCVCTGHSVQRVLRDGDVVCGVELDSGETISASVVVLACDAPAIAALAATAGVTIAVPERALGCTTLYFRSAVPLLDGDALWLNAAADATVSHAITLSNVAPSYAPTNECLTAATVLGLAATMSDAELESRVRSDLRNMGGKSQSGSAELLATWRVPYAQYVQAPGATARRVGPVTSLTGLFVASEIGHTSSLEGAARGGIAAANAVLARGT